MFCGWLVLMLLWWLLMIVSDARFRFVWVIYCYVFKFMVIVWVALCWFDGLIMFWWLMLWCFPVLIWVCLLLGYCCDCCMLPVWFLLFSCGLPDDFRLSLGFGVLFVCLFILFMVFMLGGFCAAFIWWFTGVGVLVAFRFLVYLYRLFLFLYCIVFCVITLLLIPGSGVDFGVLFWFEVGVVSFCGCGVWFDCVVATGWFRWFWGWIFWWFLVFATVC